MHDFYTKMPRLKSFLHEVHHQHGAPCLFFKTFVDIPFCGSTLPAGTNLMMMGNYISQNQVDPSSKVPLGPNNTAPHIFDAERYLKNKDGRSVSCPNPITTSGGFNGFGYGLRSCPGRSYSEILSYIVLAGLLDKFNTWQLSNPDQPEPEIICDVIMVPDCPVELELSVRQQVQ